MSSSSGFSVVKPKGVYPALMQPKAVPTTMTIAVQSARASNRKPAQISRGKGKKVNGISERESKKVAATNRT